MIAVLLRRVRNTDFQDTMTDSIAVSLYYILPECKVVKDIV